MIILSFYTQPNAVGKSGEVLESIFWSFAAKQHCSILPEDWRSPLVQLFRRMLQNSFAVKLQRCFLDYKTSTAFLIGEWTFPLTQQKA